ncbi:hypothetical protein EKO04_006257 [Ascochyta lentis]|uniref:Uncharacterized protein n=1 Tax=Ascochyta lentis TaxID=205686 RepID=A0A8H7MDB3_9PLEO|nr:hypothetical protein EKO04_006257 [Ascochyta lentis]
MPPLFTIEKFQAPDITDTMLSETAALFSSAYGIWGPLAPKETGGRCKTGTNLAIPTPPSTSSWFPIIPLLH